MKRHYATNVMFLYKLMSFKSLNTAVEYPFDHTFFFPLSGQAYVGLIFMSCLLLTFSALHSTRALWPTVLQISTCRLSSGAENFFASSENLRLITTLCDYFSQFTLLITIYLLDSLMNKIRKKTHSFQCFSAWTVQTHNVTSQFLDIYLVSCCPLFFAHTIHFSCSADDSDDRKCRWKVSRCRQNAVFSKVMHLLKSEKKKKNCPRS